MPSLASAAAVFGKRLGQSLLGLCLLLSAGSAANSAAAQPLVLVELFTSQGCSSCPPADRFFSELADRKRLAVLSWHVTYWDYIGWKDPFAIPKANDRQKYYARLLETNQLYTPQAVVGGKSQYVGSNRRAVEKAITKKQSKRQTPLMQLQREENSRRFSVTPLQPLAEKSVLISLIVFQAKARTHVKRGENAGKTLQDANIVRSVQKLGTWKRGEGAKTLSFTLEPSEEFDPLREGGIVLLAEDATSRKRSLLQAVRWDFQRNLKPAS